MATIVTIQAGDAISSSRADLNTNFANLNSDKIETSYLDTDTSLAANSDAKIATQKAVKAYVDAGGPLASTTVKGIVEEATQAEIAALTGAGATGARLFVNPSQVPVSTIQVFTANGTWTKPTGLKYVVVEAVGGGGGSGSSGASAGQSSGGGGGGGYCRKVIATGSLGATETVTIGAAGGGGTAADGTAGGNTTFGAHITAGGGGASSRAGSTSPGTGGTATGGDVNIAGQNGHDSVATTTAWAGPGGNSVFGFGGRGSAAGTATGGSGYGAGAGGVSRTGGENNGGPGTAGICIVREYYI